MQALRQAEAEVAAAGEDAAKRRSALYMLATEQAFVGETEVATESMDLSGYRFAVQD